MALGYGEVGASSILIRNQRPVAHAYKKLINEFADITAMAHGESSKSPDGPAFFCAGRGAFTLVSRATQPPCRVVPARQSFSTFRLTFSRYGRIPHEAAPIRRSVPRGYARPRRPRSAHRARPSSRRIFARA